MPALEGVIMILPVTFSTLTIALVLLLLAMLGVVSFAPDSERGLPPWAELGVGVVAIAIGGYVLHRS